MNNDIIRCVECNKILRKTDCDDAPIFVFDKNLNDFISVPRDDSVEFLRDHKGHRLMKLSVLENTSVNGYFKATDGRKVFLMKKWRHNINEPLNYKVVENGHLKVKNVKAVCQTDLVKGQLKRQFAWMDDGKADRFISVLEDVVARMDLSSAQECFWDTGDPMVVLAKLGTSEIREILRECQKFLTWVQLKEIRNFIDENNCDNGVMTVRVQKKMRVEKFVGNRHERWLPIKFSKRQQI